MTLVLVRGAIPLDSTRGWDDTAASSLRKVLGSPAGD